MFLKACGLFSFFFFQCSKICFYVWNVPRLAVRVNKIKSMWKSHVLTCELTRRSNDSCGVEKNLVTLTDLEQVFLAQRNSR